MKKTSGLTLMELLISLGILSILLGLALPNFRAMAQSVSGDVTLRKLANAIQFGKATAITNNATVTLCRSDDGSDCGGNWQDGVMLFIDSNRNREFDGDDDLLRHITFPDGNGSIRFRAFQNKQYLQLTSLGTTRDQNGNFTYCPYTGENVFARQLIINRTARLRFAQDSNGDGVREDSRGRPLDCD